MNDTRKKTNYLHNMNQTVKQITPRELKQRLENGEMVLIDVREYNEWIYCRIEGAELIPLRKIYTEHIPATEEAPIVLYCHTGQRSYQAAQILQERGYANVYNLQGGIDAYAQLVDPDIPRY